MYSPVILAAILSFCVHGGLTITCPKSSAQWCQTKQIAQACGVRRKKNEISDVFIFFFQVTEQCEKYVWKIRDDNNKVNFTLYYETLCPDCRQFMTTELWKAYQTIPDIMNITLVPYGNAHETYNSTSRMYDFVCQHGPNECVGNLIHVKFKMNL